MGLEIIFEDSDVLVINKPAGLIVHSDGRTVEPSVAEWAVSKYPEMKGVGEPWTSPQGEVVDRPGIVHRLDRTTSGVMILAKTPTVHAFLKKQFQDRTTIKEYLAYVYGHPKEDGGMIEKEIVRIKSVPPRWGVAFGEENTKRAAVTEWKILKRGFAAITTGNVREPVSLVSVCPKTGRTHQIRVHLKAINHPVLSDHLYAPTKPQLLGFTRPALHAFRLVITVPSGEEKTFEAPLPGDFMEAEKALG
jgi:23S rRNA pseudouridine1911/1915/1917 synthase